MKKKSIKIKVEFLANNKPVFEVNSEGFYITESQLFTYVANEKIKPTLLPKNLSDVNEFSKNHKGVLVYLEKNCVKIINDPFCTIPLYYFKNDGETVITSEPYEFDSLKDSNVDKSGIWETILFGSCLWNRTVFKELSQVPSACELSITNNDVALSRYWDFNIQENASLSDEKKLVEALDSKLTDIFSKLPDIPYLMGVSGGLDSRLSAAYLQKTGKSHLVNTFTYCSSKQSLDYKLAQSVCKNYGLHEPKLCILNENSYRNTLDFLPKYTCGQIGIQHSHICSIFDRYYEETPYTQISNYFSDALFGYECSGTKDKLYSESSLTRILNEVDGLDTSIKSDIELDISQIFASFNPEGNYSSLDEYKYVTERNQKFHMNLAFQQSRFIDTLLPYADFELLEFMISVPVHLRKHKKVLDLLFQSEIIQNFNIADISSRHFISGNEFANQGLNSFIQKYDFKIQNALSALTAKITKGKIIYPNKYHTESHVNILHQFSDELKVSCKKLEALEVLSIKQSDLLSSVPIKSHGVSERFQVLSLNEIL